MFTSVSAIISEAIKRKLPVQFQYLDPPHGNRVGNPHALYEYRDMKNHRSFKLDLVQTAGVSESQRPFPSFRMFDASKILSISILEGAGEFQTHPDYNPASERYNNAVVQVAPRKGV